MQYFLISLLFVVLFVLLGLGPAILILPKELKRDALFLSPLFGYGYLTLLGWYAYIGNFKGTDVYAWFVFIPALILLYFGLRKYSWEILGKFSDIVAPLIVALIVFSTLSCAYLFGMEMTSFSIGNNDIADSASVSRFLKEFARNDTLGYLGQSPYYRVEADITIFGGPLSTAFVSSIFLLAPYQIQSMSVILFFVFGVLIIYMIAKEIFQYCAIASVGIALLYGLNPMMIYLVYHGFQGQVIAMALSLAFYYIYFHAFEKGRGLKDASRYILPVAIFIWSISLTYSQILPLLYLPLGIYAVFKMNRQTIKENISVVVLLITPSILTLLFSPMRAECILFRFRQVGSMNAGWFIPWLPNALFLLLGKVTMPSVFKYLLLGFFFLGIIGVVLGSQYFALKKTRTFFIWHFHS